MTGEIGKVEVKWLLDTGCNLSLISVNLNRNILAAVRPKLRVNAVDMITADCS